MANDPRVKRRKLSDYKLDAENANMGSERGTYMIENSVEGYGVLRGGVVTTDDTIFIGNHTAEALAAAGIEDVIEVETDGKAWVVTKRVDMKAGDQRTKEAAYADNRAAQVSITYDPDQMLKDIETGVDLNQFFHDDELERLLAEATQDTTETAGEGETWDLTEFGDVPNPTYPTDNDYDIPVLKLEWQAMNIPAPALIWGETKRKARMDGTWLFYTDDERFNTVWDEPRAILKTRCNAVAEVNYSCYEQTPRALVLWNTYRKRWLSSYWASFGVKLLVDLNVNERWYADNLLGVPQGWASYITRGYKDRMTLTEYEYELACTHAGKHDILFVVYGGGKAVKELSKQRGWVWIPESMDRQRGRSIAQDG